MVCSMIQGPVRRAGRDDRQGEHAGHIAGVLVVQALDDAGHQLGPGVDGGAGLGAVVGLAPHSEIERIGVSPLPALANRAAWTRDAYETGRRPEASGVGGLPGRARRSLVRWTHLRITAHP
jgi:hypothetical protein